MTAQCSSETRSGLQPMPASLSLSPSLLLRDPHHVREGGNLRNQDLERTRASPISRQYENISGTR